MEKQDKAWAEAHGRFEAGWRPKQLLGDNTKLAKGEKFGWRNLGLSLAPAKTSGFEVCASRSTSCTNHCIFTSGRGIMDVVMMGRIFRTLWFFRDRKSFMEKLLGEIDRNQDAAIRLNVFSDIMWERMFPEIFASFPDTQFYDYTKHFNRMFRPRPRNYHLTFSLHEANGHQAEAVLQAGMNVAAVVTEQEGALFGFPIIDGDDHDLRFLDPSPSVIGLRAKGSLTKLHDEDMIYEPDRQIQHLEAA